LHKARTVSKQKHSLPSETSWGAMDLGFVSQQHRLAWSDNVKDAAGDGQ
jgi:hypothetical protein